MVKQGVFLDKLSLDCGDIDYVALQQPHLKWQFYDATDPVQLSERIAACDIIISNKVVLDATVLAKASTLKLVCIAATGSNNIDLEAARAHGIAVCNVTAYATPSVTEHVFALLLSLVRRLPDYQRAIQQQRWQHSDRFCLLDYPISELAGRVLGIVGYGELGRAVANIARAFGMSVLIAARPGGDQTAAGRLPLAELLPQVDVLSLHCPLTEHTSHLIGAPELSLMKPGAWLINTARGGIVDEQALAEALLQGRIAGAGFDVLSIEPPRQGNPLLAENIPNLIITPHIAWASREARQRLVNEIGLNITAWQRNEARNRLV